MQNAKCRIFGGYRGYRGYVDATTMLDRDFVNYPYPLKDLLQNLYGAHRANGIEVDGVVLHKA